MTNLKLNNILTALGIIISITISIIILVLVLDKNVPDCNCPDIITNEVVINTTEVDLTKENIKLDKILNNTNKVEEVIKVMDDDYCEEEAKKPMWCPTGLNSKIYCPEDTYCKIEKGKEVGFCSKRKCI